MLNRKAKTLQRHSHLRWYRMLVVIIPVAVIGVIIVMTTRAAGTPTAFEAESGTLTAGATLTTVTGQSGTGAVKFAVAATPTPTPVGSCTSGASHVPDGSDGMGGCWPGASNTGVPAGVTLTSYTSPCTITAANTVIDAKDIQCDELLIRANNVSISRSRIKSGVHGMEASGYAFTITDSEIDGAMANFGGVACVSCGVDGNNFTILRTEIVHTNRSAFCESTCNIKDSWFHGVNLDTSLCPQASSGTCPHASAVRAQQNMTLTHNTLSCDFTGPFNDDLGCSADMSGYPDFAPIKNNTIDSNLFVANNIGVGYCAYGGATSSKPYSNDPTNATNIVFKNNVFQRGANGKCGSYGPVTDFDITRSGNVWTNNKYDNGATVPSD